MSDVLKPIWNMASVLAWKA